MVDSWHGDECIPTFLPSEKQAIVEHVDLTCLVWCEGVRERCWGDGGEILNILIHDNRKFGSGVCRVSLKYMDYCECVYTGTLSSTRELHVTRFKLHTRVTRTCSTRYCIHWGVFVCM
jgi:hypothetical protein